MKPRHVALLFLSCAGHASDASAAWSTMGNPICVATGNQYNANIVSDGAGGAIVAWNDGRAGVQWDIYAQRINAAGAVLWATDGVAICTAAGQQFVSNIISDGAGGAILVWEDKRTGISDVYVQRVNAGGTPQWTANGVAACITPADDRQPFIASDGTGGAIVVWERDPSSATDTDSDVYAQRVDATGVVRWAANGAPICVAVDQQYPHGLVSDGAGGVFALWSDRRAGISKSHIYCQRVSGSGLALWTTDGLQVDSAPEHPGPGSIMSDGAGGFVSFWGQDTQGTYEVRGQRLNGDGVAQWPSAGALVAQASASEIVSLEDGAGGAYVAWWGFNSVDAQRVSGSGTVMWPANGISIASNVAWFRRALLTDEGGGFIVGFGRTSPFNGQAWVQRVNAAGVTQWGANGVQLSLTNKDKGLGGLAPDGGGGTIAAWTELRSSQDIYSQRVSHGGIVVTGIKPTPSLTFAVRDNQPNPFSSETVFELVIRNEANVSVQVFDVSGHRVRTIDAGRHSPGISSIRFDGLNEDGHPLPSGVYFYRVHAGNETMTKKMVIAR